MPANTRGTSKRLREEPISSGTVSRNEQHQNKKLQRRNPGTSSIANATRCSLLELPAEIRNRIYDFAEEAVTVLRNDLLNGVCYPLLSLSRDRASEDVRPTKISSRKYLALAQTCRQIRAEYHPIWLAKTRPRIRPGDLDHYIWCYYRSLSSFKYAPHLLQISWHRGNDDIQGQTIDILPLLRMRAAREDFRCQFISHDLAHRIFAPSMYAYGYPEVLEWEEDCEVDLNSLTGLEDLINHDGKKWLKDICDGKITVRCSLFCEPHMWFVELRYDDKQRVHNFSGGSVDLVTRNYLKSRGLLSLQSPSLKFRIRG
ncbi:hypothetical protein FB567DRAFT_598963 [Paraphoma chrysanthemicola]|uniref:F-box domain-containing protein n=1 Tax=Paraphoma chrysanthemicola TaxID=798071 RepID=A0A8K0QUU5_9PLEO|nr:hypothetical protein FB567DRAFT_598963 [Paraphoma chrysanthemicola]